MSNVERFPERAEQAERLAREMTSPGQRDQLLQIAREWRDMAERPAPQEPELS